MNSIQRVEGLTKRLRDAEEQELQASCGGQVLGADFYTTLLLLMIAEGEVANARMTWKRVPSEHRSGSVLKAVHVVLAALWKGDWEGVNVGLGASVKNELWNVVAHQVRRAELVLLARSHSVVSVSSAAGVLGCDVATAAALLAQEGWTTVDKSEGFLAAPEKGGMTKAGAASDAAQLGQLSNYIVFLERRA